MGFIKSKPCTVEGCNQPRFAKGFCKNHQGLRTDGKKPKPIIKRTPKAQEKINLKKELFPTDMAFYLKVWLSKPHICEACGKSLGNKPKTYNFDHILEKGNKKYAHLRHEPDNICLLCMDCHTNKALHPNLVELRKQTLIKLCDTQPEIQKQEDSLEGGHFQIL